MWGHRLRAAPRAASVLALIAALFTSALGPPAPVGAAPGPAEPAARLQIVVKEIKIHDDRESVFAGVGEMRFFVGIWSCHEGIPPPCSGTPASGVPDTMPDSLRGNASPIERAGILFDASTGDTVALDRMVPRFGDQMWGADTSEEIGFAVYPGRQYVVQFDMEEWDGEDDCPDNPFCNLNDYMGGVYHLIDTGEHGLGLGIHTVRSFREDGLDPGDYTITYEIRRAPLPDIKPVNIQVCDLQGSAKKRVCMTVLNVEVGHAGPFEVALKVDGVVPADGRYTVGLLASGNEYLTCVETILPASGQHTLAAVVDEPRALVEYNETNNVYEQPYTGTGPVAAATPAPSVARPDLIVGAIKLNGQVPDGKDDCRAGKNDVTVVVKNQGTKTAGDFFVRLIVDAAAGTALEQGIDHLEAGTEARFVFEGVRLKKGPHSLTATADAISGTSTGIAESDEGNNTLTVTARCTDAG